MKGSWLFKSMILPAVVLGVHELSGCSGEVDPGTPEQLEKVRQQKTQAERFQREG
jgi:hypothetical protein